MRLSPIYSRTQYAWVYETGHKTPDGDVEVEFVSDIFFSSIEQANIWFAKNKKVEDYINPKCVPVGSFSVLSLPPKTFKFKVSYVESKISELIVEAISYDEAEKMVKEKGTTGAQVVSQTTDRKVTKVVVA